MANENQQEDLGLGARVIEENRSRFLNPDGSFNVYRKGMFDRGAFSPYHAMLNLSWKRFFFYVIIIYLFVNAVFSLLYLAAGPAAFSGFAALTAWGRFRELFFYSIQIITTLGSNALTPATLLSKTIFAFEAMSGMLGFAVAAGLMFARLSNPAVNIIFSRRAVIAPYGNITGFMFRIVNGRSNELVEVEATITVAKTESDGKRSFHQLPLERSKVLVFPLNWTIVHPITKESPLYGMSAGDLEMGRVEFLASITAIDQDLSKKVYARHSYIYSEISVGAKFINILESNNEGSVVIDPARIHEIEEVKLPLIAPPDKKRS